MTNRVDVLMSGGPIAGREYTVYKNWRQEAVYVEKPFFNAKAKAIAHAKAIATESDAELTADVN